MALAPWPYVVTMIMWPSNHLFMAPWPIRNRSPHRKETSQGLKAQLAKKIRTLVCGNSWWSVKYYIMTCLVTEQRAWTVWDNYQPLIDFISHNLYIHIPFWSGYIIWISENIRISLCQSFAIPGTMVPLWSCGAGDHEAGHKILHGKIPRQDVMSVIHCGTTSLTKL